MPITTSPDLTGLAPSNEIWRAVDDDLYDGAPDTASLCVGHGSTEIVAVLDYVAQMIEAHLENPSHGYAGLMREAQISTCTHLAKAVRDLAP